MCNCSQITEDVSLEKLRIYQLFSLRDEDFCGLAEKAMGLFADANQDKTHTGLSESKCSLCRGERQITGDRLYMKGQSLHPVMKSILRNEPCQKCFTEIPPS